MTIHHLIDGNMLLTVSNNNKHYRLELNKNGTCIAMTTDYNDNYKHEYIQGDIKECLEWLNTQYDSACTEEEKLTISYHLDGERYTFALVGCQTVKATLEKPNKMKEYTGTPYNASIWLHQQMFTNCSCNHDEEYNVQLHNMLV